MTVHVWDGWPGAVCMKCGREDPYEMAEANKWIIYDLENETMKFDTPEHEAEIRAKMTCPAEGD